jgi:hypothetical protein
MSRTAVVLLVAGSLASCGTSHQPSGGARTTSGASVPVREAPPASDFVTSIDNPWMPLPVGTEWHYVGQTDEGTERTVVTVTPATRMVAGVRTTVVHDVVHLNGTLLEDTFDWFAQDSAGNVWYFGEDTKEYAGKKVDRSGSWESGVHGAKPGIAMLAHPTVGKTYRQEYLRGQAEDEGKVLATDGSAKVPYGDMTGLLKTLDFTRLEPKADEHKFYARGVGMVFSVSLHVKDQAELVSMTKRP